MDSDSDANAMIVTDSEDNDDSETLIIAEDNYNDNDCLLYTSDAADE